MKLIVALVGTLLCSLAYATPDFRSADDVRIEDYQGQVLYVDFWASWCVPCRESFPWLIKTQEKYAAQGLQILAINVDAERQDAESFLNGMATNFPIVLDPDGKLAERYDLMGMPSAVLIGRDGKLIHRHTGFREKDKPALDAAIQAALKQ